MVALGTLITKEEDKTRAAQIWRDFRWSIKTLDGDYTTIDEVLAKYIARCEAEIVGLELRTLVVQRFSEMRARLSEFTVEPDDETL